MKSAVKSAKVKTAIQVRKFYSYWEDEREVRVSAESSEQTEKLSKDPGCTHVTEIRITPEVTVGTLDRYLCFWVDGREVRVGPLSPEQAEKLSEDLGYDGVE